MNAIRPKHILITTTIAVLASPLAAAATAELMTGVEAKLEASRASLIELRRDIHRHPEVSGQEKRTSGAVAKRLRKLGLSVTTGVGGYGVVAILKGGRPGPLVAFRADMDAVHSTAPDPVPFRSEIEGVRHICGHDIHTTIGVALAEGFAAVRETLPGSVMFVFQPAEENATGARAMIADGALQDPSPAAIFAVHTAPMAVGQLITTPGTLMSWRDRASITFRGAGDVAAAAAKIRDAVMALGTVPPAQAAAPASGDFLLVQAPPAGRGADGHWNVAVTISTATEAASNSAKRQIEEQLASLGVPEVDAQLSYEQKWVAGVTNDPQLTEAATASIRSLLGESAVLTTNVVIPAFSEDFGSFQQIVPGVMFFLGVSNPEKGWVGMPHTPGYVADEESIFVGARSMAKVMLDFLARSEAPSDRRSKPVTERRGKS